MKCSKSRWFLGLHPIPRWGAYDAPPDPLVVRVFLPSAIAASRLRRLQLPHTHVLVGTLASRPRLHLLYFAPQLPSSGYATGVWFLAGFYISLPIGRVNVQPHHIRRLITTVL